ncbi:MAG TPA: transporter substrate-binding domain-containing protein [Solirubrobacterales bacterium]
MGRSRLTVLTLALAVSAVAIIAAGCGGGGNTTGESGGSEKLTVGSDVPYPPFEEFGQTKTEFKGFDVELMEAIGERIGREPEFTDTSFDTIFVDLAQGKFEAVASATTITEEREETVDFTEPYYQAEQAILVQKGGKIDSVAKLKGATVGAQKGTTGAEFVEENAEAGELRTYPQGPDAVNAVKSGVVEAVVIDIPVAENAVKNTTGIEVSSPIPTEEEYGFAVAKNNEGLLEELNEGLAEVKEDGTYAEIYENWFHRPPSKEIVEVKGGAA